MDIKEMECERMLINSCGSVSDGGFHKRQVIYLIAL
jgi:hypothetical protein